MIPFVPMIFFYESFDSHFSRVRILIIFCRLGSYIDTIEKKPPPMQMAIGGTAGLSVFLFLFLNPGKSRFLFDVESFSID